MSKLGLNRRARQKVLSCIATVVVAACSGPGDSAGSVSQFIGSRVAWVSATETLDRATSCRTDKTPVIGEVFNAPSGVAVDSDGSVTVADTNDNAIVKVAPPFTGKTCGTVTKIKSQYKFGYPYGVAADSRGNRYFTDEPTSHYPYAWGWKITRDGKLVGLGNTSTRIGRASGIAVDRQGNVYVADIGLNDVVRVSPDGTGAIIGTGFNKPYGVAVDAQGVVYVADTFGDAIYEITSSGKKRVGPRFKRPYSVAVDARSNVYVDDGDVKEIKSDGTVATIARNLYGAIALGSRGTIYVASPTDNVVYRIVN